MSNGTLADLTKIANLCVEKMKSYSSSKSNPPEIADAIHLGSAQASNTGYMIDITIPLSEAPMAAAYEWGSGEHAMRGDRGKYIIAPRYQDSLMIEWADWPSFVLPVKRGPSMIGEGDSGLLLRYVEHPGVEARPYIEPAITDTLKEAKNIMKAEILSQLSILSESAKGSHREVIIVGSRSS